MPNITLNLQYNSSQTNNAAFEYNSSPFSRRGSVVSPTNNGSLNSFAFYSSSFSLSSARNTYYIYLNRSSTSFVPNRLQIGSRTYNLSSVTSVGWKTSAVQSADRLSGTSNRRITFKLLNSSGQSLNISNGNAESDTPSTPSSTAPTISSFKIFTVGGVDLGASTTVTSGTTVNLRWAITGTPTPTFHVRVSGSSSNLATSGTSLNVSPTSTTTYTLTATNSGGTVSRSVTVTVSGGSAPTAGLTSNTLITITGRSSSSGLGQHLLYQAGSTSFNIGLSAIGTLVTPASNNGSLQRVRIYSGGSVRNRVEVEIGRRNRQVVFTPTRMRVGTNTYNMTSRGSGVYRSDQITGGVPTSTTARFAFVLLNAQGQALDITNGGLASPPVLAVRPAITSFTAEAIGVSAAQTIAVSSGAQVILRWTITGTPTPTFHVRLQGTNTNLATTGTSVNVNPARTSVYVLTATNSAGSAAANVRVNVPRTNLIRVGTKVPNHIFLGTTPVRRVYLGRGTGVDPLLLYRQENPPTITTFTVAPSTIDLDTRPSGTITFTINVTGVIQEQTLAQIVQLPNGNNIGATIVAAAGSNIAQTLPNILQPTQTTSYRLFARNIEGVSHRDFTISVTQNARISNFRRTGFSQRPDGTRFQFTARISGTPQPVVTWRFGNGRQSQRDNDSIHFTSVGTNQWDAVWGGAAGIIHPVVSDSLVWTVRNSTGSATETISNIST